MKRLALALALALSLQPAVAAAGVYDQGNGGELVICPVPSMTGEIFSHGRTLLDLQEGKAYHGYTYRKLRSFRELPLEAAFSRAVDIFLSKAPFRHYRMDFAAWFRRLPDELGFQDDLPIGRGSRSRAVPRMCRIELGAIQFLPFHPRIDAPGRIHVSKEHWLGTRDLPALPTDLKVALLFHEYVYRHDYLAQNGCPRATHRNMTAYLLSDQALAHSTGEALRMSELLRCPY